MPSYIYKKIREMLRASALQLISLAVDHFLLCVFPYCNSARDVNIEASNDTQLRNFHTLIDCLQELNGNPFFLFAQEKHDGLVGELEA
jgi:hypothetical protein